MGAYATALAKQRVGVSERALKDAKNARKHAARLARKAENKLMMEEQARIKAAQPKLTPEQQLKKLDQRFGVDQGCQKQRKKLHEEIKARTAA